MKIKKLFTTLMAVAIGCSMFAACSKDDEAQSEAANYVSLRINPEIELLMDDGGTVITANAINDDGEVVLSMVELEGMSVESASVTFTETAEELGYFDPEGENDTVYVGTDNAELEEKVNKNIRDYFTNKGINGKVSQDTLDKYADKAAEWGISKGHTKIVMRVLDAYPEFTDEEILELKVKDWLNMLKVDKKDDKIAAGLKSEYSAAIKALRSEYAELFTLRAELEDLLAQLDEMDAKTEEAKALKTLISQQEDALKPLQKAFDEALAAIKAEYKEQSKEMRKAYKAEGEKRKKEFDKKDKNKEGEVAA
ncbi:MAG: hypothetical protein IJV83_04250 [Clostridia bacterium]|nr:hypothetical protein [Clostridia bacterium]